MRIFEIVDEDIEDWNPDNLDPDNLEDIKKLAVKLLQSMNKRIRETYDRDHQIGHSYFIPLKECKNPDEALAKLKQIWHYEILPLLQEYFYDNPEKLEEVLKGRFIEATERYFDFKEEPDFLEAIIEVAKS